MSSEKSGSAPPIERRRWPRQSEPKATAASERPRALEPLQFSTKQLAAEDQFAAWRAIVEPLADVSLPDGVSTQDGFAADLTVWNLGSMLLVQQAAASHSFIRSAERVRSSSIDHWTVIATHDGRSWTEVDGLVAEGRPGTVEFRSLARPFRGRSTASKTIALYLPRELLSRHAAVLDARNNSVLVGSFADLAMDLVDGIVGRLGSATQGELQPIVETTRDLVLRVSPTFRPPMKRLPACPTQP